MSLPASAGCGSEGSICTLDGRSLGTGASLTVAAGPLTAEKRDDRETHDGTRFNIHLAFNMAVDVTAESLRDGAFAVANGEVVRVRKEDTAGKEWEIRVLPYSNGPVRVALPATTDCAAAGAVCTRAGAPLSNALVWEIAPGNPDAVDETAPAPESAEARFAELEIVFTEGLDESSVPASTAFAATVGGAARALAAADPVRVSGRRVFLALTAPVRDGEAVTVSYAPPEGEGAAPLRDLAGNAAAAIDGLAAANATPRFTVRLEDVPATHDGVKALRFRLVFSEPPAPGVDADAIRFGKLSMTIGDAPFQVPQLTRLDAEGRAWQGGGAVPAGPQGPGGARR